MSRILVVDNDRDMCAVISDILTDEGHKVAIAFEGEGAIDKIRQSRYDLVMLDYKLPDTSGIKVLEEMMGISPTMPAVMISAYGNNLVKSRAKELGARDFIDKPFDIKKLISVVQKALGKRAERHVALS